LSAQNSSPGAGEGNDDDDEDEDSDDDEDEDGSGSDGVDKDGGVCGRNGGRGISVGSGESNEDEEWAFTEVGFIVRIRIIIIITTIFFVRYIIQVT